jgi:hypothetical protein
MGMGMRNIGKCKGEHKGGGDGEGVVFSTRF